VPRKDSSPSLVSACALFSLMGSHLGNFFFYFLFWSVVPLYVESSSQEKTDSQTSRKRKERDLMTFAFPVDRTGNYICSTGHFVFCSFYREPSHWKLLKGEEYYCYILGKTGIRMERIDGPLATWQVCWHFALVTQFEWPSAEDCWALLQR
jgi:hypothetical protein